MSTATLPTRSATRRAASYRNTAIVVVLAILELTAMSQAHHHYAPKDAGGWRELPFYAVTGLIAYGVVCLGLLRVNRTRSAATLPRLALVFGVLSVLLLPFYFTVLPLSFAGTAGLLARDARTGTMARVARILAVVSAVVIVGLLVLRLFGNTWNLGG